MKVLKFYADWCGPCKSLTSVLERMGSAVTVPVEEINIDERNDVAMHYGIRSVPTMILVDDNNSEIRRRVGLMNEAQINEFLSI